MSELSHQHLSPELQRLEFYQRQESQRTLVARTILLTVIFGMLAANIWMTRSAHVDMLTNLDQARLAQVQFDESADARVSALASTVAELEQTVARLENQLASEESVTARTLGREMLAMR